MTDHMVPKAFDSFRLDDSGDIEVRDDSFNVALIAGYQPNLSLQK